MSDDFEALALAAFATEAEEMLRSFEQNVMRLATDKASLPPDPSEVSAALSAAMRAAHTIKGSAGIFGMQALVKLTHEVESAIEVLQADDLDVSPEVHALLLQAHDAMQQLCTAGAMAELGHQHGDLIEQLQRAVQSCVETKGQLSKGVNGTECWVLSWRPNRALELIQASKVVELVLALVQAPARLKMVLIHPDRPESPQTWAYSTVAQWSEALTDSVWWSGFDAVLETTLSQDELHQRLSAEVNPGQWRSLPLEAPLEAYKELMHHVCGDDPSARLRLMRIWQHLGIQAVNGLQPSNSPNAHGEMAQNLVKVAGHVQHVSAQHHASAGGQKSSQVSPKIRVESARLDELIERMADVTTTVASVREQALQSGQMALLDAALAVQTDLFQARGDALALRMVPVADLFARFPRLVRELSVTLGREVEFLVDDGHAELDRALVDAVADPLMHLIRNAMDHGIELPAERTKLGKPAKGHLALSAYRDAGHVVIELKDDGRGLNRQKIVDKAIQRGLLTHEARLSDAEVLRLICSPGFSTAEQVTEVSGRGVGMDVVKRNVEALHGELLIQSEPGRGTCFRLRIPMTLASLSAFCVQAAGGTFLVPMDTVMECIQSTDVAVGKVLGTFDLRSEEVAAIDLSLLFKDMSPVVLKPDVTEQPTPIPAHTEGSHGRRLRRSWVVVRCQGVRLGLCVDRLLGEQQVVIRSLGPLFQGLGVFSGTAVLNDGSVGLLLDAGALQDLIRTGELEPSAD